LLTQCWAIGHYLRLSLWPAPLVFDYGTHLVTSLADVWPQAVLVLGLLAATAWALVRKPAWGLLGLWFFAILAPSSSFVPIATEPVAEQRMYLPLVAVVVALAAAAARFLPRRLFVTAAMAATVALGLATARRNGQYRDPVTLWTDTVAKNPGEPRGHNNLGTALRARGEATAARAQFTEAIRLRPDYAPAQFNLGVALLDARQPADALPHLERATAVPRHQADLQLDLGQAYAAVGRYGDAVAAFRRAVELAPASAEAHGDLGNALLLARRAPEAVAEYRAALELRPGDAGLRRNLAVALESVGPSR
jgi:Flp pilus assembly protein TadD